MLPSPEEVEEWYTIPESAGIKEGKVNRCENQDCRVVGRLTESTECHYCGKKTRDFGLIPMKPGYYWALWTVSEPGTLEGEEQTPAQSWEIVQVNANHVDWDLNPTEDEALSVSIPGVGTTQWRDNFLWGEFVAELEKGK